MAVEPSADIIDQDACRVIREMLTAHGVPTAGFVDDHVANAIAQRNILAEALIHARVGTSQDRAAAIDAAIAKAYPSGIELRCLGDAVVRHLKSLVDGGLSYERGKQDSRDTEGRE